MSFFSSTLEQFVVLPVASLYPLSVNFNSIFVTFSVITFSILVCFFSVLTTLNDLYIIPSRTQIFFENIFSSIIKVIQDNLQTEEKKKFFPFIIGLFFFFLSVNLSGIMPYTFTVTSELIITFSVSLFSFIGIQIISIRKNGLKFFSAFFPSGVSVLLSLLLVPIEFISFFFKPISLAIRLFANMMAGHTLLKVIAGFIWLIMGVASIFSIGHFIPLFILIILFIIEIGVAIIQSLVFTVLICIYLNDLYNLH